MIQDDPAAERRQKRSPTQRRRVINRRSMSLRMIDIVGLVWALPITLFGLLLAAPVLLRRDGRIMLVDHPTPALFVTGALADRMLVRHPLGSVVAITIGHVVLVKRRALSPRLAAHELAHVRQAARWGLLFPLAYAAASGWVWLRGKQAYWDNPFEVAARQQEHDMPRHAGTQNDSDSA